MKKLTIGQMVKLAESQGGKCLSVIYINANTKLLWECSSRHTWMATPSKICQGRWCRKCFIESSRLSLSKITELIQSKGGELLSKQYYRTDQNLEIRCQDGHIFLSSIDRIRHGSWCKYCLRNRRFLGINLMRELATKMGGMCLSNSYQGIYYELEWQCAMGHKWTARPDNIRQGKWCPNCASFKSERKVRFLFEQLTGFSFVKTRKILTNLLELDGYCHDLKVAFEYQGRQHYEFLPKFYYKTQSDFAKLQFNDKKKIEQCQQLGIELIIIPYFENSSDINLEKFIRRHLIALGVDVIPYVDFSKFYSSCRSLILAQKLAYENGGKLLSNGVPSHNVKLRWQCKDKHEWDAPLSRIQQGRWCKKCAIKKRSLNINRVKIWAQTFNGHCLSSFYTDGKNLLRWRCCNGHEWEASYRCMKNRKNWCVDCSGSARFRHNKRGCS